MSKLSRLSSDGDTVETAFTLADFRRLRQGADGAEGGDRPAPPSTAAVVPTVPDLDDLQDLSWRDHAACRPELRPPDMTPVEWTDMFFPPRGDSTRPARQICAGCPVLDTCLQHAIDVGEKHGVWGGVAERGRRRLRRQANAARRHDAA